MTGNSVREFVMYTSDGRQDFEAIRTQAAGRDVVVGIVPDSEWLYYREVLAATE